jgi:nucleotide-binding universal stress UspA family protein
LSQGKYEAVARILVAIDGSEASNKAIELGAEMARSMAAQLALLHVVEIEELPSLIAEAEDEGQEELGQMILGDAAKIANVHGIDPIIVLRKGHPVSQILHYAETFKPQLIIMGSHGRTGAKKALLGSKSSAVTRKASCSVVIVR